MILDDLAAHARERVRRAQAERPLEDVAHAARELHVQRGGSADFAFERALQGEGLSFICEVKKASPSKGVIDEEFAYLDIARAYEEAGADCLSVLTEPKWFLGSDAIFSEIRAQVTRPMIRKDFVVDAYQIYEAKLLGADAALLICALLDDAELRELRALCDELGMSALVEAHDEAEVARACNVGARMVGVNNRNLKDFTVDVDTAARLRDRVPAGTLFVAESGIMSLDDVQAAARFGADAVLVGEFLMRAPDKRNRLAQMREAAR